MIPHPHREWLIQTERGRVAVSPALGRMLRALDGQTPGPLQVSGHLRRQGWRGEGNCSAEAVSHRLLLILAGGGIGGRSPLGRSVWLRLPLLPGSRVEWLARRLQVLASTRVLALLATGGAVLYVAANLVAPWPGLPAGRSWPVALLLVLMTALWHELGHASALQREGYPPGRIGWGILFILPVLWTDVSAVAALPRRGKLRVDLAGVCFQVAAGGVLTLVGGLLQSPVLSLAGGLALLAVLWSLLPFIRADGYWALADLLNLRDLEQPRPRGRGRGLAVFLLFHRSFNALFLVGLGLWLPLRLHALAGRLTGWLGWAPGWLLLPVLIFTALAWWGLVGRLFRLYAANRLDLLALFRS